MISFDVILEAGMLISGSLLFTLMTHEIYCIIRADYRRQQARRTAGRKGAR